MKIFKPLWIKVDNKRGHKTPNMVKPWPKPRCKKMKEKQQVKRGRATRLENPTICPGHRSRSVVVPTNLLWLVLFSWAH